MYEKIATLNNKLGIPYGRGVLVKKKGSIPQDGSLSSYKPTTTNLLRWRKNNLNNCNLCFKRYSI